ncbi:hypothetical protein ACS15_3267 [Ralstonia insidiosa]|uniref:Uncharacterized protein n=1 Tax=Ralstonia insidiosa TaxID=190721 RepID=A0AAC9BF35_9RALS|nr:hypothetical protein ACS15_3267 [Ralstonia insidiosa]
MCRADASRTKILVHCKGVGTAPDALIRGLMSSRMLAVV